MILCQMILSPAPPRRSEDRIICHRIIKKESGGQRRLGFQNLQFLFLVALLTSILSVSISAAPPVVSGVDLRGLQIGKATLLTITGTDLLPNPRLLTTARIAKQTLKDGAKPERIVLEVELAEGSQPGLENWWLVTDNGVSARSTFATDQLPQKPFAAKTESLPVALHGTIAGSQVRDVTFTGKAGQEIICEVEAQRLESKLRPVLKLYGPNNALVKWSLPLTALRGDTRLEVKLPADGEYRLQVHDLQFAAAAPGHFRVKIGQWAYADLAFPSTVQRGTSAEVQLVGRGGETRTVRLPSNADGQAAPAPWADPAKSSGPQAAVWLSDVPELIEGEGNQSAVQVLPALPVAVNGRISKPGEEDAYELTVEPGTDVDMDVTADAHGSPIDAELEVRDIKGARLAINDDSPDGPDPRLTYKVPKDVTKIIAVIRDVNGNGGPRCIYRFHAAVKAAEKSGGFTLKMIEDSHTLEPGRAGVFKVEAVRDGYEGPIELTFDHLPEGVKISGQKIPAQATGTLLTLSSDKPMQPIITALKGRAKDHEALARFDSALLGKFQPWLENDLALAGAKKSEVQFSAGWGQGADAKKVPLSGKLILPVKCSRPVGHDGPVRLTLLTSQARQITKGVVDPLRNLREEKAVLIEDDKKAQQAFDAVAVAKTALTKAQDALTAANKAADAASKAAEAAAKKAADAAAKAAADAAAAAALNKAPTDDAAIKPATTAAAAADAATKAAAAAATADDAAKKAAATAATAVAVAAKNIQAAQTALATAEKAAADAALKAKNDVEFSLVVPAEMAEVPHQIAFKAELLKRDRRTVEAVAYTPVHDFPVINPLVVKITPPAPAKLDAKTGATLDLVGQVERLEGAKGDVTLTLADLPPGVTAPATAIVKADQTQFKFPLKFPANFKPGEFSGLKISGTGKPYGTIVVKTRDALVDVKVLPPDPPTEPKPASQP